jgi:hypothetical protein
MADWVVCPTCNLRHSLRADGACPRCKNPVAGSVESAPAAPAPISPGPSSATPPAPLARPSATTLPDIYDGSLPPRSGPGAYAAAATSADGFSAAARIAGGLLLVNAMALFAEKALLPAAGEGLGRAGLTSALIDLGLGVTLLIGNEKALLWARVRAGLGLLVLPLIHVVRGDHLMAVIQLVFSSGLLALLLGRAGLVRTILGTAVVVLCLGLEGLGLMGAATGSNPLTRWTLSRDVEPGVVTTVTGEAVRYELTFPGEHWYARKKAAVKKDNAVVDRWLVFPERDAHVMIIAEQLPGGQIADMDKFAEVVLQNARKAEQDLEVIESGPLATSLQDGRLVHTRGSASGLEVETYHGLYIHGSYIIQVMAFCPQKAFPAVESEFQEILSSMSMP